MNGACGPRRGDLVGEGRPLIGCGSQACQRGVEAADEVLDVELAGVAVTGFGLGTCRWVAGQSIALLHRFRRLRVHWEMRGHIHEAFLSLACAIICWRLRNHSPC